MKRYKSKAYDTTKTDTEVRDELIAELDVAVDRQSVISKNFRDDIVRKLVMVQVLAFERGERTRK